LAVAAVALAVIQRLLQRLSLAVAEAAELRV
jgi:hypothetical protein